MKFAEFFQTCLAAVELFYSYQTPSTSIHNLQTTNHELFDGGQCEATIPVVKADHVTQQWVWHAKLFSLRAED